MPVYEYACKACEHEFELEQRITDKPAKKCPKCGALKAKRLISRTSFVLKGSGWYSDLYSKPASKSKDTGKGEGAKESGSGGDKSTGSESSPSGSGKSESGSSSDKGSGGSKGGKGSGSSGSSSSSKGPPAAAGVRGSVC